MRDYLAILRFDTPLDLLTPRNFEFPSAGKVRLLPLHKQDPNGIVLECGIEAEVTLKAASIEEGLDGAAQLADTVLNILSLVHGSAVSPPNFDRVIIDATPGTLDRKIVQILVLPKLIKPRRGFSEEQFLTVWEHLNKAPPKHQPRISMALHWYRKALLEPVPSDQFGNLWSALETLNPVLKEKNNLLPDEQIVRRCSSCGAPVNTVPTLRGVEYALTDLINEPKETWQLVHRARRGLQHPPSNMEPVFKDVLASLPVLTRAVPIAIFEVLDVPAEKRAMLTRMPLIFVGPPRIIARAAVLAVPHERAVCRETMPHFELNLSEPILTKVEGGQQRKEERRINLSLVTGGFDATGVTYEWQYQTDPEDMDGKFQVQLDAEPDSR
jgi:hypothetical protein